VKENERVLRCVFHNENELFLDYMPYVKDGGLFIRTHDAYDMGDKVTLSIQFFEESEVHFIEGKVVWMTPEGARGNKPAGIGVQFYGENKRQLTDKIKNFLAEKLNSVLPTHTM